MLTMVLVPVAATMGAEPVPEPETGSRAILANLPYWAPSDTWTYRTIIQNEDRYIPGTGTLHIEWFSDNSTYVTADNTEACGSDECYKLDFTGNAEMNGDVDGTAYTESDSNSGWYHYRVSDLAFVGGDIDSTSTITMSGITMTCNLNSDVTTNTPLTQFEWPMEPGNTWDVKSKISQSVSGSCTTPFGNMPVSDSSWTEYDYTATVQASMVDHNVYAGTFSSVEVHESGTINRKGEVSDLDQYNYFAPEVKRHINLTQEGEQLKGFNVDFFPDLWIKNENISVSPDVTQDVPATINATVWNTGDEDATGFNVKFSDGSTEITTESVTGLAVGGSANLSVIWTPDSSGQHTITVKVDAGLTITEYFENNNEATIDVDVAEPTPDLKIEAADISAPAETPINKAVTLEATVHNVGSKDASAVVVRFFDGTDIIGDDITYDSILKDDSVTPSVIWTPTSLGSHTIKVKVDPNGSITEMSESNNEAVKAVEVVQLNFSFTMTVPTSSKEVGPNETADFQINIKNTGKKQDNIDVVVAPPTGDWTASADMTSVSLTSGSSQPVVVSVHSPIDALAGDEVNVTVRGTSNGDPAYKHTVYLVTTVKQVAGISPQLKTSSEDLSGYPKDTVSYDFEVKNTGNAPDTFTLSLSTQKGWTTTISGSSNTGELAPGAKKTVSVQTTIPEGALAGDTEAVTMTAKSMFDTTYEQDTTVVITCLQVYDLSATVTPPTDDVEPGSTATYTAKLTNDGNGEDLVNLSLRSVPEIPADWVVNMDDSTTIRSDKEKDVVFTIEVPEDAAVADYVITLVAEGGDGEEVTAVFSLNVLQVYDIEVEVMPTTATVKAGKTVTYTVTVTNNGNGQDEIEVSIEGLSPKFIVTFSEEEVVLEADGSTDVVLTIRAKSSAKGSININVLAESKDGDASDSDSTALSVKVEEQTEDISTYLLIGVLIAAAIGVAAFVMFKRRGK